MLRRDAETCHRDVASGPDAERGEAEVGEAEGGGARAREPPAEPSRAEEGYTESTEPR